MVVDHGRLAGIVTNRDLMLDIVAQAREPQSTRLGAIMQQDVATIKVEASIEDAVRMMRANACRRLPIVDGENIVGMRHAWTICSSIALSAPMRFRQ